MKTALKNFVMQAVDTVLPPRCVMSGEIVDRQGMLAPESWGRLDFIGAPQCRQCGFPFEFEAEEGTLCVQCMERPPPFETARSALKYNDASRDLVLGFKHGDQTYAVRAFVPWLQRAGEEMLSSADVLIPVPLHRWRLLKRRYNQSLIIARALSKASNVPVLAEGLRRVRSTPVQGYMKAAERHKNVRHAFAVPEKHKAALKGKSVILIDDVYTTGATVKECTKALLKSGAKTVHVLTLTRTVRDEF